MSDDILNQIDDVLESMERNRERFDPFGPDPARQKSIEEPEPDVAGQLDHLGDYLEAVLAAGPSAAGNPVAVDVRRRVQDGSAPIPAAHDRVAELFKAEVLRQGLTECEIDGVSWQYCGGQWSVSNGPARTECGMAWPDCRHCRTPDIDAALDTALDVPRKSKLSQLAAALRARARRGGR